MNHLAAVQYTRFIQNPSAIPTGTAEGTSGRDRKADYLSRELGGGLYLADAVF